MKIKLKHPKKIDEKLVKEIDLNLEGLTGEEILKVDTEIRMEGNSRGIENLFNQDVLVRVASKASGILQDDLKKLSAFDFLEVTFVTRNFLLGWSASKEEQETSEEDSSNSPQPVTQA